MQNAGYAQQIAATAIQMISAEMPASAAHIALQSSLVTQTADMAAQTLVRLQAVLQ